MSLLIRHLKLGMLFCTNIASLYTILGSFTYRPTIVLTLSLWHKMSCWDIYCRLYYTGVYPGFGRGQWCSRKYLGTGAVQNISSVLFIEREHTIT